MLSSSFIIVGHGLGRGRLGEVILSPIVDKFLYLRRIEGRIEGMDRGLDIWVRCLSCCRDQLTATTLTLDVIGQWLMRLMMMYIHDCWRMMYFDMMACILEAPVLVIEKAPFLLAKVRTLPISLLALMKVTHPGFMFAYLSWRFIRRIMRIFFHWEAPHNLCIFRINLSLKPRWQAAAIWRWAKFSEFWQMWVPHWLNLVLFVVFSQDHLKGHLNGRGWGRLPVPNEEFWQNFQDLQVQCQSMLKKDQPGERFLILARVRNWSLIQIAHGSLLPRLLDILDIICDLLLILVAEIFQSVPILSLSVQACFAFCEPNVSDNMQARDCLF